MTKFNYDSNRTEIKATSETRNAILTQ